MREIKFKAKRVDNGEWVYSKGGIFTKSLSMLLTENSETKKEELYLSYVQVIPETICQYTGLKDKNGVDIYEGDVLFWNGQGVANVKYCEDGKIDAYKKGCYISAHSFNKTEITGNKHD